MDFTVPQTREQFAALARSFAQEQGISIVAAIYQIMDKLSAIEDEDRSNPPLACASGCSVCCYQPVSVTKLEWRDIERYVIQHGILGRMRKQINGLVAKWKQYRAGKGGFNPTQLELASAWIGKPCVFLDTASGKCGIYPVRPVVCRTYTSTVRCTVIQINGSRKYDTSSVLVERYAWQRWADDFMMEMEGRGDRSRARVTPLLALVDELKEFGPQRN